VTFRAVLTLATPNVAGVSSHNGVVVKISINEFGNTPIGKLLHRLFAKFKLLLSG
jgi:hypothetical protein